jgi:Na+/glutamate symporter
MQVEINLALTVVAAILVLLVGRTLVARVGMLQRYSIPEAVVGGLAVALLLSMARAGSGLELDFDMRAQSPLLLAFFSTIGLGADLRTLGQGGRKLLVLLAAVVLALLLQNGLGLGAQALLVVVLAVTVTFRLLGRDYDAAVIAAGQCAFQLGATPTAIANMQAITSRHGPSPLAFPLVPVIGAFLIDISNALVIQGFLALPLFGF